MLRHSAADALGSLAVLVSGALVLITGWDRVDPITGIFLGVLILAGSWRLISEPIDVLMEAAPSGVDVQEVGTAMAAVDGVREVHDLHVWTVTSGFPALAAHVRTDGQADYPSNPITGITYNPDLPPDIMSYDSNNDFFSNTAYTVTEADTATGVVPDPGVRARELSSHVN